MKKTKFYEKNTNSNYEWCGLTWNRTNAMAWYC
jgi:hypothetical protein